ncbi:MAG: hypothetical protein KAG53_05435 [Endozoicomonadaceae bacterium]|nr:hypothetical protein [Endozoicomonadaceae bacterium]
MGIQYGPSIVNWGIQRYVSGCIPQFFCKLAVHGAIESTLGYANIGSAVLMATAAVMPSPRTIHENTTQPILNQITNSSRNNHYQQLSYADDSPDQTAEIPTSVASPVFGAFQLKSSDSDDDETLIIEKGNLEDLEIQLTKTSMMSTHATETDEGFIYIDAYSNAHELQPWDSIITK